MLFELVFNLMVTALYEPYGNVVVNVEVPAYNIGCISYQLTILVLFLNKIEGPFGRLYHCGVTPFCFVAEEECVMFSPL